VTGSDHRVIIWETKRDPTTNTLPSKVGERIRWDISRMSEDDKDEAELLWLTASETRPTLDDFSFCEDIESETYTWKSFWDFMRLWVFFLICDVYCYY
jgi:hypothetical protein